MTTISQYLSRLGKKGGKARALKMTPEERSEAARKAVQVRWAEHKRAMARIDKILAQIEASQAQTRHILTKIERGAVQSRSAKKRKHRS